MLHRDVRRKKMSIGISTAIGLAFGAAYGASTHQLALFAAIGTAAGATLDVLVHLLNRARMKRMTKA
jgi:hypothetical protein